MSTRRLLTVTGDVALQLLRLTAASADVFPPLKSVASGVLYIAEIIKKFRSNKKEWMEFLKYVQDAIASVIDSLARTNLSQTDLNDKLGKLQRTMEDIVVSIKNKQDRPGHERVFKFLKDPDMITSMRKELDDAIILFALGSIIATEINVEKTLDSVVVNTKILSEMAQDTAVTASNTASIAVKAASISRIASKIGINAMLEKLPYVQGASWDQYRVCLPGTRIDIIDQIIAWAGNASEVGGARIYLLTAVAGAGKTTIAHTVARHFAESGRLVSSFFFDRETERRNTPIALITTIAADLAQVNEGLSSKITAAIGNERGLPYAPLSRQFQELVLKPCLESSISGRRVIVIDALDEGCNDDLLKILCDEVPRLPGTLHILLTSRMQSRLGELCRKPHVQQVELDIDSSSNLHDIAEFISHRLQQVASSRNLGDDWPGPQLKARFTDRAGGLFIWVATFCNFLLTRANPTRELEKILSDTGPASASAESQMDKLYARILESCDWDDEDFVSDYHRIMGIAIATKVPLTISAQNALFKEELAVSDFVLNTLSPLLTGMSKDRHGDYPVRVIHQSLRDFLVFRAVSVQECAKFQVDEEKHSQDLALLCLRLLNRDLRDDMVGVGYLVQDESELPGVPTIGKAEVTEALGYASRFWIDHLLDVKAAASVELLEALESFLQTKVVLWMEVMGTTGHLRGLSEVREWVQTSLRPAQIERLQQSNQMQAEAFLSMSSRLAYDDRRQEALTSAQESSALYQQLAKDRPTVATRDYARALNILSTRLSDLGHREQALVVIQQGTELYQQLATERPAELNGSLAASLNNLSLRLTDLSRHEEALAVIQEATKLNRQLARERPAAFSPELANSLNTLSICLFSLGRCEEALTAIHEAVELRRHLAKARPASFTPVLANSLNTLSICLSSLGHREEALKVSQEMVELRRQLAKDRQAVFTPDLAQSLNTLSNRLSSLGHYEEALTVIQEATELYRQLAKDRPAAFNPELSMSLNNLSTSLFELGCLEEALNAIQEAIELYRHMAKDLPAAFTPDLATSLNNLSAFLACLGYTEEGLAASQEAAGLCRQLAKDRPAAFNPNLAASLYNLSLRLFDRGCHEDAVTTMQESTVILRQLAKDRPAVFAGDLTDCLNRLVDYYESLGYQEEAQAFKEEVDEMRRTAASDTA